MFNTIKKLCGFGTKVDFAQLIQEGAVIIDVRTKGEYDGGHIKNSVNMPLQTLQNNLSKVKKDKPVITCCASGIRSASATRILKSNGFTKVHNGGGWLSLKNKI